MYFLCILVLSALWHCSSCEGACQATIKLTVHPSTWERDGIKNSLYTLDIVNTGTCSFTGIAIQLTIPPGTRIVTSYGLGGSNSLINNFGTLAKGQTYRGPGIVLAGGGVPSISINSFVGCGCQPTCNTGNISPSDQTEHTTSGQSTSSTSSSSLPSPSFNSSSTTGSAPKSSFNTIGLKFLLLACNYTDVRAVVARTTFTSVGTPYDELTSSYQGSAPLNLINSDGSGKYLAIISATELVVKCWNQNQIKEIEEYERKFSTKTVIMYTYPYPSSGMQPNSTNGVELNGAKATFATDFLPSIPFFRKNAQMDVSGIYSYPAHVIIPPIATPAIYGFIGKEQYIFGAFINYLDGRRRLELYFDQGEFALYSSLVGAAWFQWASNGIFAGLRRIEFNAHIDDVFMATGAFNKSSGGESETDIFRISPSDLKNIKKWQASVNERLPNGSLFVLTFPFNMATVKQGGGTASDPLYLAAKSIRDQFFWESHTYSHPYLDNMTYERVKYEFNKNTEGAMELFDNNLNNTNYCRLSVVTPSISGLYNGAALKAMWDVGIRYVVGDNSRLDLVPKNLYHGLYTNSSYNGFDGIYILPRHATNIYYFASTVKEIEDQFNLRYESTMGYYNFTQIVKNDVEVATKSLLTYRHDPFMFHQANMRSITIGNSADTSLLGYWIDCVLDSVLHFTTLPLMSHTHDNLAQMYLDREARDGCGFSAQLKVDNSTNQIVGFTATSSKSCRFAVSGAVAEENTRVKNEVYGSERTIWIDMVANSPVYISFSSPIKIL